MSSGPPKRQPDSSGATPPPRDAMANFRARAEEILAISGGLNDKSRPLLLALATELGLQQSQFQDAVRSILSGEQTKSASDDSGSSDGKGRATPPPRSSSRGTLPSFDVQRTGIDLPTPPPELPTEEPQPPPRVPARPIMVDQPRDDVPTSSTSVIPPPPPNGSSDTQIPAPPPVEADPADQFCESLRSAFSKVGGDQLDRKLEKRAILLGNKKYGLAKVYARQLVRQEAEACGMAVTSQAADDDDAPDDAGEDPRLAEFLFRAAPILAQYRGINVQSRVRLAAIARELDMSDDEMEEALKSNQEPESSTEISTEHQELSAAFRKSLVKELPKLPGGLVNLAVQKQLIEAAQRRYGLSRDLAEPILLDLVRELNLRWINREQAVAELTDLAREQIADGARPEPEVVEGLLAEGRKRGFEADEVEAIIKARCGEVQLAGHRRRKRLALALAATTALVVAVGAGVGGWALFQAGRPSPVPDDTEVADDPNGDEVPGGRASPSDPKNGTDPDGGNGLAPIPEVGAWWDSDLTAQVVLAKKSLLRFKEPLAKLASPDADVRIAAYQKVVNLWGNGFESGRDLSLLEGLLISCYALDPDDTAAASLLSALLTAVPQPGDEVPTKEGMLDRWFWAVETAVLMSVHEKLTPQRAQALASTISDNMGGTLTTEATVLENKRQALKGLCQRLYRVFGAAASTQALVVQPLQSVLSDRAISYLDPRSLEKLDTQLVCKLVPALGEQWVQCKDLLLDCVGSNDPHNVLDVLELFERTENSELQTYLRVPLLLRADASRADATVEEVARLVRERFGATVAVRPVSAEDRYEKLQEQADEVISSLLVTADHNEMLFNTAELNRLSTLGCALAQGELGYPTFDELIDEPVKRPSARGEPEYGGPPIGSRATDMVQERMRAGIVAPVNTLDRYRSYQKGQRLASLRLIQAAANRLDEVTPQQGTAIATYLLAGKSQEEHDAVISILEADEDDGSASGILNWNSVRVGLADELGEIDPRAGMALSAENTAELVGMFVDDVPEPFETRAYRRDLRKRVLRNVIGRLSDGPLRPITAAQRDVSMERIYQGYCWQARLLGISDAQYKAAHTPADVLRLLIDFFAAELSGNVVRQADRRYLRDLPYQLTAADYLGTDELRRTVLYDRIWMRLVAITVAVEQPERVAETDLLIQQTHEAAATAGNLVAQLRDIEKTLAKLWLLRCKP